MIFFNLEKNLLKQEALQLYWIFQISVTIDHISMTVLLVCQWNRKTQNQKPFGCSELYTIQHCNFNAKDGSHFFLHIVSLRHYISMKISHEVALHYTYYLNEQHCELLIV